MNSRSGISVKHVSSLCRKRFLNVRKPSSPKGSERQCYIQSVRSFITKVSSPASCLSYDNSHVEHNSNSLWRHVKEYLCMGDFDSAFIEVLHCHNNHLSLLGLVDRTGPVLQRQSPWTSYSLLSVIASDFLDQQFIESILPWMYQVNNFNVVFAYFFALAVQIPLLILFLGNFSLVGIFFVVC